MSFWGDSWGDSWGNSWGLIIEVEDAVSSGGSNFSFIREVERTRNEDEEVLMMIQIFSEVCL